MSQFKLDTRELKHSYSYGNFMATVLLAQSFIEQSLGAGFSFAGDEKTANKGFSVLVDSARESGYITERLPNTLDKLRKIRNPYIHHIGGTAKRSYMGRFAETEFVAPEDLVVEDAKFAIRAVVDYLREGSPDWNPDVYQRSEDDNA